MEEYVYNFTAESGLMIENIEYGIENKVIASFFYYSSLEDRKVVEKARKYKIYTTNKGNYFNYKGSRMYLNEFIRIEL